MVRNVFIMTIKIKMSKINSIIKKNVSVTKLWNGDIFIYNQMIIKGYYLHKSSCFSSGVKTICSGTSSCSVILIKSSDSKNCSNMYFGAISTKD